jgi:hypothetical protein
MMSETNLPKEKQRQPAPHQEPLPTNPTEMLRFQCQQLQYQNQLLMGIQVELQKQRKILSEHSMALNKHTKALSNISTVASLVGILIILSFALSMCAPLF